MIKKCLLILLFNSLFSMSFAQSDKPTIKKSVSKISDFVPAKWKLIAQANGDLNKDGLPDVALVIEHTNPKNFISNANKLGGDTLNTNPRYLLVAFKKANGTYELAAKNTAFIPPPNSEESPCLEDPFGENGSIEIAKGLLSVHFQNFYSCGAWEIYNFDYIFRYQNQKFELIGYNKSSMHRSTGEEASSTMNFSTMKANYSTGTNAFKDGGKPKTIWKKIKSRKLLELNTITEDAVDAFTTY
ncbi:hypothetical protein [Pedobacter sp. SL55]|uniref:hypothetical protein n=1 Tax=Pedobacter sp. SL55 TaxID=2995161 RepID=UPI00227000A7|nr:hypothetical protein [Pedobacter sp. SL55]WAC42537.1 hypothetical protein OVA16_09345 [Pedobacter sp. SL55]